MAEKGWGEKEIFIKERGEGGVSKYYISYKIDPWNKCRCNGALPKHFLCNCLNEYW